MAWQHRQYGSNNKQRSMKMAGSSVAGAAMAMAQASVTRHGVMAWLA